MLYSDRCDSATIIMKIAREFVGRHAAGRQINLEDRLRYNYLDFPIIRLINRLNTFIQQNSLEGYDQIIL